MNLAVDALADTRVVVLSGARQVGKSTLAEKVLKRDAGGIARFLDDPQTRASALEDPVRFVRHDGLMLIDEVQRVPALWLAIKDRVDRQPIPGQFLLTGSARLLALREVPDALVGRAETIELWPLSQGEIDQMPERFIDAAYHYGAELRAEPSELQRSDYLMRAARGGYPEAVSRNTPRRRAQFFENYLSDLISRDIQQAADIRRVADMRRLFSLLAAQTSGLVNVNRLANELNIVAGTVKHYLEILETIYLVKTIPAWSSNLTTRAVATPKVIFVDSGIAHHLTLGTPINAIAGPLIENFVLGELARQITWSDVFVRLYHYRDRDQYEVDAILEDNAGNIIGIEVKAAESLRAEDFRGLKKLRERLGSRFRAGFVLYCGTDSMSFGEGLACLPISALWTTQAPEATA